MVSRNKKISHEGVKFACDQCDYKATWKSHLLTHIKSIHEGLKIHCDQCDYKSTGRPNLLRHIKSKHEGYKFHCDQCDFKATGKHNLSSHIKSKHERMATLTKILERSLLKKRLLADLQRLPGLVSANRRDNAT